MFTNKGDGDSRGGIYIEDTMDTLKYFNLGKYETWNDLETQNEKQSRQKWCQKYPQLVTHLLWQIVLDQILICTEFFIMSLPPPSSLFSMICTALWLCLCPALISNMPAICLHFKWNRRRFIVCAISLLSSFPRHPPPPAVREGVAKVSSVASTTWSINYVLLKRILWRQIWAAQTFQSAQLQSVAATLPSPVCPALVGCR